MNHFIRVLPLFLFVTFLYQQKTFAQDSSNLYSKILYFPNKLFKRIDDKAADVNRRLTNQTAKYLKRMEREESKLQKLLAKKDSIAAAKLFADVRQQYANMKNKLNNVSSKSLSLRNKYIPHLDSLSTAFAFFGKTDVMLKNIPDVQARLTAATGKMDVLQQKFNQTEQVKKFLAERKALLQEQLKKYGLSKQLNKLQQQVYYYQAQVEEYKNMFANPSKLETKALNVLKQSTAFRDFFSKNSKLAELFRLPGSFSGTSTASLAGLQTREMIEHDLMQRFGAGPNVQQMMQQQLQSAQGQLNQLKDKLKSLQSGSKGNGDPSMPDFRPNDQKTKPFKRRLELGSNLQTVKASYFFPSTTDIGLSLGYKLNDKSVIGIGSSYKMGWGKDIMHISITHQGVGLRTFMDYKIKGSFWLSGGAEANYLSQFDSFDILSNYSAWQRSALIGLSKKYHVSKKLKGNAQVLYDFLWREQVPRTQPVMFRIGYNWK